METSDLIKAYAQEPISQGKLDNFHCTREIQNSLCGDSISIYLCLSDDGKKIEKFGYSGDPQMFTLASASILAENIEGKNIDEVLNRGGEYMKELGLHVSPRRKRSTVSALLAVHNALYSYLGIEKIETYEDILAY